jgi:hypothetical protein
MERLLSGDEVLKLCGGDCKLITYPELAKYKTLKQLFGNKKKVIMLYLTHNDGQNMVGHWVLLTRVNRKGKTIIEFNDSYGLFPDKQLNFVSKQKQEQLGQDEKYLTKLLYEASKLPNTEIHYNEMGLQKKGKGINSCGRWVGFRGRNYLTPLEDYQAFFKDAKKRKVNLDELITIETNKLLGGSIFY